MARSTMTSKGRITVPREVREHLGLTTGDQLDFRIHGDGTVTVEVQQGSAERLWRRLYRSGRPPVSVEEVDDGVRDATADDLAGVPQPAARRP